MAGLNVLGKMFFNSSIQEFCSQEVAKVVLQFYSGCYRTSFVIIFVLPLEIRIS